MKRKLLTGLISSVLLFQANSSFANEGLFTGDTKLSCEAILCLSSGERPSECKPALQRYFSISHKKLSDTLKARKNFLQICPSSNEQGMPELVKALANGAGRCDASELNRVNQTSVKVPNPAYQQCTKNNAYRIGKNNSCENIPKTITKIVNNNKRPAYCTAYFAHGWTYKVDSVKYVGDPLNGGKWVNQ